MARRMAMSDADVMRLLAQDKKEYIEYPPERGDRYYEEDEIDEEALAQMIIEHGVQQGVPRRPFALLQTALLGPGRPIGTSLHHGDQVALSEVGRVQHLSRSHQ